MDCDMTFKSEKEKYLNMSKAEKRKLQGKKVTAVDDIPSWVQYWNEDKISVKLTFENTELESPMLANKICLWQGDITNLEIDVIVNAANCSLLGGGGVDGAIHRLAGPYLKKECYGLGGCETGEAKITGGYMLPAKYIIHTVGPRGEKEKKLSECYENSINLAIKNNLRTIAFPCISTGIYGYPPELAANVAITTVKKCIINNFNNIDKVVFCVFLPTDKTIYETLLQKYFRLR